MTGGPGAAVANGRTAATSGKGGAQPDDMHRPLPDGWFEHPDAAEALSVRDIGAVYAFLQRRGVSQRRIGALTGQNQGEVSAILQGRHVVAYDVLERIAVGLGVPRGRMGLAYHSPWEPFMPRQFRDAAAGTDSQAGATDLVVLEWNGAYCRALRLAKRVSVRAFALRIGISDRMVSKWEAQGTSVVPRSRNQVRLDGYLKTLDAEQRKRFHSLMHAANVDAARTSALSTGDTLECGKENDL